MPDAISNDDKQYSADLKLKVVLGYIRNPKRKRRICEEHRISEELLDQWHQQFLRKADQIFADPSSSNPATQPSNESNSAVNQPKAEPQAPSLEATWGIRFNKGRHTAYQSASTSKEAPSWLRGYYREKWESEDGIVLWDDATQKMEVLKASKALDLLQELRQRDNWQTQGIVVTEHVRYYKSPDAPKRKRSRKQEPEEEPAVRESKPEYEDREEERIRLNPQAAAELISFLEEHEAALKQMAEADEKQRDEALSEVYSMILSWSHRDEEQQIDLSQRPLLWVHHEHTHTWVCDLPPNRGTVSLHKSGWAWVSCIEQPDRFKRESPFIVKLEEALAWTENELLSIQKAAAEVAGGSSKSDLEGLRAKPEMDLTPYHIDAASLEPERITYRVIIEFDRMPIHFKTMEMSFGKLLRYEEEFPGPLQVARELQLDSALARIEQPIHSYHRWNVIYSTATYYEESVAPAQAQRLWDASGVQRLHKDGKVSRARYGYEEIETGYCRWLGGLEDPERLWPKPESRDEYMADCALRETITYALDVDRFRERMRTSPELMSDERLLDILHHWRARSKHIPAEARAESERWLREHPNDIKKSNSGMI